MGDEIECSCSPSTKILNLLQINLLQYLHLSSSTTLTNNKRYGMYENFYIIGNFYITEYIRLSVSRPH